MKIRKNCTMRDIENSFSNTQCLDGVTWLFWSGEKNEKTKKKTQKLYHKLINLTNNNSSKKGNIYIYIYIYTSYNKRNYLGSL